MIRILRTLASRPASPQDAKSIGRRALVQVRTGGPAVHSARRRTASAQPAAGAAHDVARARRVRRLVFEPTASCLASQFTFLAFRLISSCSQLSVEGSWTHSQVQPWGWRRTWRRQTEVGCHGVQEVRIVVRASRIVTLMTGRKRVTTSIWNTRAAGTRDETPRRKAKNCDIPNKMNLTISSSVPPFVLTPTQPSHKMHRKSPGK